MEAFALRAARRGDLPAVRELLGEAGLPLEGVEDQFDVGFVVATPEAQPDDVIGVAGVETYGRFGLLRSVAVAPGRRGRAVGGALVRDRIEWARARGLEALYLLTTTAGRYFPRCGFAPVARPELPPELRAAKELVAACPATAEAMWLRLRPAATARP